MCGRFVQADSLKQLSTLLDVTHDELSPPEARYNIAPAAQVVALCDRDERVTLAKFEWGLIPSWSKDPSVGQRLTNARAETVWEKPSFRSSIRSSRVVVPADGFFEWSPARRDGPRGRNGRPVKEPHYFTRGDGQPMLLGGISSEWTNPMDADDIRQTLCLLTTAANTTMQAIHHRMPVIIESNDVEQWLTTPERDAHEALDHVLSPASDDVLVEHVVSAEVNNSRNEGEHLIAAVDEGPTTLF
ncbi:MAG: SOS response-associated peptidase [Actinomycetota bacterium]